MDRLLDILAALADPTRLRIFLLVREMQLAMGELAAILDQSQPRVSRHVRLLAEAGLVRRRKEGAWVFVDLDERAPVAEIHALVDRLTAGRDLLTTEHQRLARVRAERQQALDGWFAEKAGEWDLVSRLGGEAQEQAVEAALIAAACQSGDPAGAGRLLDIGTGTGRVLALLAGHAHSATGVDRSPEMLRLARAKLSEDGRQLATLHQADMQALPFADGGFDTVTLIHVLHFAADPAAVIAEAARMLAPGGQLLVADYAPHNHEELRTRFHHARLGFEPETVLHWLQAAGLAATRLSSHKGKRLIVHLWSGQMSGQMPGQMPGRKSALENLPENLL